MANSNLKGKFIKISSNYTYYVFPDLGYYDQTDTTNPVNPNKLNIRANWTRKEVKIKRGIHWYPAEISEWNTVKALSDDAKITIGEIKDSITDANEESEAKTVSDNLKKAEIDIARQEAKLNSTKKKTKSMADIASQIE